MADTSQGPGWWLASDGKWYPPEQAPGSGAGQPHFAADPLGGGDPLVVELASNEPIANWRPLVHWLLVIPHYIVNYVLGLVRQVLWLVSFFTVLFAKKVPEGIRDTQVMILRYGNRMMTYVLLLSEQYPPFEFQTTAADPGGYPLTTSVRPTEELARWRCLQPILLIPHAIVLTFVGIGAVVAYIVGWFAVLFTGRQPHGISKFLVGVGRWVSRVTAYSLYLTDKYPPFSLD